MPNRFKVTARQVGGSSVNLCRADNVVACLTDVGNSKHRCRLAGRCEHGCHAALQIADFLCYDVVRRVLQTGIEVAVSFQIEQFAHILAGGILKGGGLDNGDLAGFAVAGGVTALHADSITIHTTYSFTGFVHIAQFPAGVLQPPAGN